MGYTTQRQPQSFQYDDLHRPTADSDSRSHDAAGNTTLRAGQTLSYDDHGRLVAVSGGGQSASYQYNGRGERVSKTVNGLTTRFVYHTSGQLLAETDASHTTTREYLWLEDWPVAMVSMSSGTARLDFIHADHLGTPRRLTDSQQAVIWRWDSAPFGDSPADADPDGDSVNTVFNLRFPGLYFDSESGLHYNYFRDYDPGTGRYVQSDPIGLAGGINTYSYVSGSPLIKIDPTGLIEWRGTVLSGGAGPLAGEIYTLRTECIDGKRGFARIHAVGGSLGLGATWAGGKVSFEDGNPGLKSNISDVFDGIYAKAGMGAAWGIGVQLGVTRLGSAITTFGEEFGVQGGLDSSIGFGFGRSTVIESRIEECSNEYR